MTLKTQAIQTALTGDWRTAIFLNLELLKENPNDIETLNRLGFAYSILGKVKEAKDAYQSVLRIDGQNPIALKNLKRLGDIGKKNNASSTPTFTNLDTMFIEESGKTKVVELINVADPKIIGKLMTGELLTLSIKRLKIFLLDRNKQYVGMLPDDLGKRLIKFIKGGNEYSALIKAADKHHIIIFMKETTRCSRFKNQSSFTLIDKNKTDFSTKNNNRKNLSEDKNLEEEEPVKEED